MALTPKRTEEIVKIAEDDSSLRGRIGLKSKSIGVKVTDHRPVPWS